MAPIDTLAAPLGNAAAARGLTLDDVLPVLAEHADEFLDMVITDREKDAHIDRLRVATEARIAADATWRSLVADGLLLGISRRELARAAGTSHTWVGALARQTGQQD